VARGDGNGWVRCRCGQRHWGLNGAAGLLLLRGAAGVAEAQVLMQLRAGWTHQGGSWGLLGGARDSHEGVVAAALREAAEEGGVSASSVRVVGHRVGVDHVDWSYTYVLGLADVGLHPRVLTAETDELRWVAVPQVQALLLHPALGEAWPRLAEAIPAALSDR
jgi:8-oxo-dGTP diphosphatase